MSDIDHPLFGTLFTQCGKRTVVENGAIPQNPD